MNFIKKLFRKEKIISKRVGTFETNSSSTHSLVLADGNIFIMDDFSKKVFQDDFINQNVLKTWKSKIIYLLYAFKSLNNQKYEDLSSLSSNNSSKLDAILLRNNIELFEENFYFKYFETIIKSAYKIYTGFDLKYELDTKTYLFSIWEFKDFFEEITDIFSDKKTGVDIDDLLTVFTSFIFDENTSICFDTDILEDTGGIDNKFNEYVNYWSPREDKETRHRKAYIKKGWIKDEWSN